jgi:exosortase A-associated hydrolase 2
MPSEQFLRIPTGNQHAFGVLHEPLGQERGLGLLFCAPFAEEQKSAYRVFVEFARRLATKGVASLRFDYRGTGDSDGDFPDYTLEDWVTDTLAAAATLKERGRVARLGILGLRLGGLIAVQAARRLPEVSFLALWQPILNGAQFHRLEMRRFLVRQMMTKGKATKGSQDLAAEADQRNVIDMDGYLMRKDLTDAIKSTNLANEPFDLPARTLLLQISHTDKLSPEYEAFAERHKERTACEAVVSEPFWNRVGFVDTAPVFDLTEDWILKQTV